MEIQCPKCNRTHKLCEDIQDDRLVCSCGRILSLIQDDVLKQLDEICKEYELKLEEEKVVQIRKMADNVVSLILNKECTLDDVEIEQNKLKELINEICPDKIHLYELIYEPRFKRLWSKFREEEAR